MAIGKSNLILSILLIFALVAGCIGNTNEQTVQPQQQTALTGDVKLDGATTVFPIAEKAAKNLMASNPGLNIIVKQSNTGGGYEKLINGEIDIAYTTRPYLDNEYDAANKKGVNLHLTPIFYDAVSVITHPSNPISDISFGQLKDIYFTGNTTDWSLLTNGTKKEKINIYNTNPKKLGTAFLFNKKVAGSENAPYVNGTTQFDSLPLMGPAIANDTNGIGYTQIAGIPPGVKILKVNGVAPSKQTILDATYPMSRQVFLVTNGEPKGNAKAFINYILSKEGQKIVDNEGFISLT